MQVVRDRLSAGRGLALATINLDHLVKLRHDKEFRAAYAAQDLVVADGNPVVWLSRLARRPVRLAPGSDLVEALAQAAAETGAPIALVGSTEPVLIAAGERMKQRAPGLEVAACIAPPMGFSPTSDAADQILEQIAASGARLCFLALGAPKQEIFAARGRARLPQVAFVSVGAGLDFIGGSQKRAPALVRRVAMEWLWRALSAPRRMIPRYASCFAILPSQIVSALRQRVRF